MKRLICRKTTAMRFRFHVSTPFTLEKWGNYYRGEKWTGRARAREAGRGLNASDGRTATYNGTNTELGKFTLIHPGAPMVHSHRCNYEISRHKIVAMIAEGSASHY